MATTEQTILETAERLLAETGKIPTVEAVREALGGGSFSTLSPVLRDWRRQHQSAAMVAGEIPARVREALERSASALWGAFREEVEERIDRAREEADIRAGEAESERDQALQEVTRLETALAEALDTSAREREALSRQLEDSRAAVNEARQEIATLTERTRQQENRLEGFTAELARAHEDGDAIRQQLAAQAGRFEREQMQARAQGEALAQKLDAEREARQAEQTRAAELAAKLAGEQEARARAEQDREAIKGALAEAREREKAQGEALEAERQARRALEARAADLRAENARLSERAGYVDELRQQVKTLQERLTPPANENKPEGPAKPRTRKPKAQQPEG